MRTPCSSGRRPAGRVAAVLLGATLLAPLPAAADGFGEVARDAGMGAAASVTTFFYAPFKMAFAAGGLIVGGITWLASGGNDQAALAVMAPTGRGDYVVTPSHLRGQQRLAFVGPEVPPARNVASGPAD